MQEDRAFQMVAMMRSIIIANSRISTLNRFTIIVI